MGVAGKGCGVKLKQGKRRMGWGRRGALLGQVPGAFPGRGAPPAPTSSGPFSICPGHRERGQSRRQGLASWWRLPALGTAGFPLNQ